MTKVKIFNREGKNLFHGAQAGGPNVWDERIDTCVLLSYSLSFLFKERTLFYTFISGDMITRKKSDSWLPR